MNPERKATGPGSGRGLAIGLVVAGLGQFTATEMLSDPGKPQLRAPDLAMLLDVQHELDL